MEKLQWNTSIYNEKSLNFWFCFYKNQGKSYQQIAEHFVELLGCPLKYSIEVCKRREKIYLYLQTGNPVIDRSKISIDFYNEYINQGGLLAEGVSGPIVARPLFS